MTEEEIRHESEQRAAQERIQQAPEQNTGHKKPTEQEIMTAYYDEDVGAAKLFSFLCGDRVRYSHDRKAWFTWQGHYWEENKKNSVRNLIVELVGAYRYQAGIFKRRAEDEDKDTKKILKRKAKQLWNRATEYMKRKGLAPVLDLASSWPELAVLEEDWQQPPTTLVFQNGVLDMVTGILRPGKPEDMMRIACPIEWDGEAKCPIFDTFLSDILGDAEMADYVLRVLGYAVSGVATQHQFYVHYGEHGRNGKTTLFETLLEIFGEELVGPVSAEIFLDQNRPKDPDSPTPSLADLENKVLVWASETNDGRKFDAGRIKFLSGGDTITCRAPYGRGLIRFRPKITTFLLTNSHSAAPSSDDAFWERYREICYDWSYVENPKKDYERQQDPLLRASLLNELPGIACRIVQGFQRFVSDGGLPAPEKVMVSTKETRTASDHFQRFYEQCCFIGADPMTGNEFKIQSSDLTEAFGIWALKESVYEWKSRWSAQKIGREATKFAKRTPEIRKSAPGARLTHYFGLTLSNEWWDELRQKREKDAA